MGLFENIHTAQEHTGKLRTKVSTQSDPTNSPRNCVQDRPLVSVSYFLKKHIAIKCYGFISVQDVIYSYCMGSTK